MIKKKTGGKMPAPERIVECVKAAADSGFTNFDKEGDEFAKLCMRRVLLFLLLLSRRTFHFDCTTSIFFLL